MFVDVGNPAYFPGVRNVGIITAKRFKVETKPRMTTSSPKSFVSRVKEVSVSPRVKNSPLIRSLIFSFSGVKVNGGVRNTNLLKNTEKIVSDFRKTTGIGDSPVVPTEIKNGDCVSFLLITEQYGRKEATGMIITGDGSRAIASPVLIPPVLSGAKVLEGLCRAIGSDDEVETLTALYRDNPFINTGEAVILNSKEEPRLIDLTVSLRSAGVVRNMKNLIAVENANVYDRPGNLRIRFVNAPNPLPIYTNKGEFTITFTKDTLRDKRAFALVLGLGMFERVESDFLRVVTERMHKKCSKAIHFRAGKVETEFCISRVVKGDGNKSTILAMSESGEIVKIGSFDPSIIELSSPNRSFVLGGFMWSDRFTLIPIMFGTKSIRGYLVDREEEVINRAVINI